MIYPSILDRRYQEYFPFISQAAIEVKLIIVSFCEHNGYAFSSRIKTIESLAEKIETGRFKCWQDLDDLFACTIIIPTLSHEEKVVKFCKNIFQIDNIIKRGQNKKSPDTFTFDSTRIYARMRRNEDILIDNNLLSIYDIKFEIQAKSAFEHAWAVSTHDLVYKNDEIDWKRLRLVAQIKANVEQLDTLILAFEQTSSIIQENEYSDLKTKRKLGESIEKLFRNSQIPDELKPKDLNRFCDNLLRLLPQEDRQKRAKEMINIIESEVKATPTDRIPRSISLFQYFLAILIQSKMIQTTVGKYHFHITQEFELLYPELQVDGNCLFRY